MKRRRKKRNPPSLEQMTALRLGEIADITESGIGEMTGKLRYDYVPEGFQEKRGEVVGRFGGIKGGFKELESLNESPKVIAAAIRRGSGVVFDRVYGTVRNAVAKLGYRPARKRSRGKPVIPAHPGNRKCRHCGALHTTDSHRFHGAGSFHRTHLWGFNPPARRKKSLSGVKRTVIYGRVLRIEAKKTQKHICDDECKKFNHSYFHDFKPGAVMYGLPNGDILIKSER